MSKMSSNLMLINKIIIFDKSILDEDIDYRYFTEKVIFDINFINKCLEEFWNEYLKFSDIYKKDDFIKSYSFTLKRYYKYLLKILDSTAGIKNLNIEVESVKVYLNNIKEKIDFISDHKSRSEMFGSTEQFINEEEYHLLLDNDDEINEDK